MYEEFWRFRTFSKNSNVLIARAQLQLMGKSCSSQILYSMGQNEHCTKTAFLDPKSVILTPFKGAENGQKNNFGQNKKIYL